MQKQRESLLETLVCLGLFCGACFLSYCLPCLLPGGSLQHLWLTSCKEYILLIGVELFGVGVPENVNTRVGLLGARTFKVIGESKQVLSYWLTLLCAKVS